MHNTIIESERKSPLLDDHLYDHQDSLGVVDRQKTVYFHDFLAMHTRIHDVDMHVQLQKALSMEVQRRDRVMKSNFILV
jgi:hypothetical protein